MLERTAGFGTGRAGAYRRQRANRRCQGLYFPTISLTGAFGSASSSLSDLFKGSTKSGTTPARFIGPIFTFGAVSGQVAQAEASQQAALASYKLAVQSAFADVDNALVVNLKIGEQLAAQRRLVAALADYERLAKLQYDAGYVPYSTVLQAQQTLFPAELTLAALRASVLNSSADIYKAMGAAGSTRRTNWWASRRRWKIPVVYRPLF